jgi:hypothetical protein
MKKHPDMMMKGFIWSISGAGPIRMVATIGEPLGFGPMRCQGAHQSLSTDCLWVYFFRLTGIATWNLLMMGAYCKVRQDTKLTKTFLINFALHIGTVAGFWVFSLMPGSADFLNNLLGNARTDWGSIMTYIGFILEVIQLTAFFPKIFVMWVFAAPCVIVLYILSTVF